MTQAVERKQVVDNYTMFRATVQTLAGSQGFYSRMNRDLLEMSSAELEELKDQINNCGQKFYNQVDVILWLEG